MRLLYLCVVAFGLLSSALRAQIEVKVSLLDSVTGAPVRAGTAELKCPGNTLRQSFGSANPVRFQLPAGMPCTLSVRLDALHYQQALTVTAPRHIYLLKTATSIVPIRRIGALLALREAVVRAVRTRPDAPVPSSTIHAETIETINTGKDLPFLLETLPAVVTTSDAGTGVGYTGFRVRGIDPTRINVTLNGIPLNDAESHGVWWVDLPDIAASADMIQLQRGLGLSTYGGGGLGANLNISTEGAAEKPFAKIYQSVGSFRTMRSTVKAATGRLPSGWGWMGRASYLTSDGWIDRAFSRLHSYYLSGEYFKHHTRLHLVHFGGKEKTYQAWYGVPVDSLLTHPTYNEAGTEKPGEPYDNETDNYWQYHWQAHLSHQWTPRWIVRLSGFYVRGYGYYEQYKAAEAFRDYGVSPPVVGNDTIYTTDLIRRLWLDNRFYGAIASGEFSAPHGTLTFGGGMHQYIGNHYGKVVWAAWAASLPKGHRWYDLDAQKTEGYVFIKGNRRFSPSFSAMADVMLRHVRYDLNGFRDNPGLHHRVRYLFPNPRLGLQWHASRGVVNLFAGWGHKEPNRDDYEAAAGKLPRPERLLDVELGWQYPWKNGQLNLTLYDMEYRDQLVLTGKINDVGAYTRENVPRSFRRGVEMEIRRELMPPLQIRANYAFNYAKIRRYVWYVDDWDTWRQDSMMLENVDLAFSPRHVASAVLSWQPLPAWQVEIEAKYVGEQYLDNTQHPDRRLEPYFLLNARLRYAPALKGPFRKITAGLDVFNLFNTVYASNGWAYVYRSGGRIQRMVYVYPQAPRHGWVSLKMEF